MVNAPFKVYIKDPTATLDYSVDWTAFLAPTSDTIASIVWTIQDVPPFATWTGAGGDLVITSQSNTSLVATVWLSNGYLSATTGYYYQIQCQMTSTQGRQAAQSFQIAVQTT